MSADLFQLIHSMSKAEKKHFSKEAAKGGERDSNYLQLYDILNGMDEYSDELLLKKLKRRKKDVSIKYIAQERQKLQKNILSSMRNFHMDRSPISKMNGLIMDAQFLRQKGLHKKCEKILRSARNIAEKYELHAGLLEIIDIEQFLTLNLKPKNFEERIDELATEKEKSASLLQIEEKLKNILHQLTAKALVRNRYIDDENRKNLTTQFNDFINQGKQAKDTKYGFFLRNYNIAIYHKMLGEPAQSLKYYQKTIDWWKNNEHYKEIYFKMFFSNHYDFINTCSLVTEWTNKIPELIATIEKSLPNNREGNIMAYVRIPNIKLLYYLHQKDYDQAKALISTIDLDRYRIHQNSKLSLLANIVATYFVMEAYKECTVWADKIIQAHFTNSRQDIQIVMRILNCIAHYELNELDKLDDIRRSFNRYLKNHTKLKKNDFYKIVLEHLQHIFTCPPTEQKQAYKILYNYLMHIEVNTNRMGLGWGELNTWVSKKLQLDTIAS